MPKLDLTNRQMQALVDCLDMVLSIQGSIRKGDPDFDPLRRIECKARDALYNNKRRHERVTESERT